jgi:hypothetical protein
VKRPLLGANNTPSSERQHLVEFRQKPLVTHYDKLNGSYARAQDNYVLCMNRDGNGLTVQNLMACVIVGLRPSSLAHIFAKDHRRSAPTWIFVAGGHRWERREVTGETGRNDVGDHRITPTGARRRPWDHRGPLKSLRDSRRLNSPPMSPGFHRFSVVSRPLRTIRRRGSIARQGEAFEWGRSGDAFPHEVVRILTGAQFAHRASCRDHCSLLPRAEILKRGCVR